MAQLNPNFEIDFNDINSYEQIQLMNDTQLAKENLLMHRAYQEPADDEIIRNHFSSFTFVDFCPKLFTIKQPARLAAATATTTNRCPGPTGAIDHHQASVKYYELETFSDLFERINKWLKLNKDWRVVSMETLVFDCKSHFNYLKSSIRSTYLPQNKRGLRLFLSPSKSRFSGPQKIGCINVVPRKLSGSHTNASEPLVYETLGDILNRLNELLLTRPIEGRILSVETITLPMSNGYVNTESNYFMDSRLNLLYQCTYNSSGCCFGDTGQQPTGHSSELASEDDGRPSSNDPTRNGHCLIDILRVYYEFGPMVGGLVNLIDFIPRFYSPTPTTGQQLEPQATTSEQSAGNSQHQQVPKEAATESLTRLIRRSLAWFESERKRVLAETTREPSSASSDDNNLNTERFSNKHRSQVNLKVCNLQVHHKTLLKCQLLNVNPSNVIESLNTRSMLHEPMRSRPAIVCDLCSISSGVADPQDWCSHLLDQTQTYQLKFVRLAYVVPVCNRYARSVYPLRSLRAKPPAASNRNPSSTSSSSSTSASSSASSSQSSSTSSSSSASPSASPAPSSESAHTHKSQSVPPPEVATKPTEQRQDNNSKEDYGQQHDNIDTAIVKEILNSRQQEEWMKVAALAIVSGTNERHRQDEESHQLGADTDIALNGSPIGQLTYRLFAPCQLVKSSSCFSINPVNSSSPLARRGSLDLNGSGINSEDAHPSTALLLGSAGHSQTNLIEQSGYTSSSSGPFFPNLNTSDFLAAAAGPLTDGSLFGAGRNSHQQETNSTNSKYFASNEFELVDAIKRRMEVYVTTNSMKVIAGETLIINLSDSLSCLSTAIEQTVMKAPSIRARPSTWVCVYVLYAAVDEPHLPAQLLANQQQHQQQQQHHRLSRQLEHIDEEHGNEEEQEQEQENKGEGHPDSGKDAEPHFDDDFKCDVGSRKNSASEQNIQSPTARLQQTAKFSQEDIGPQVAEEEQQKQQAQEDELLIADRHSVANIYNSAYDRTVALPTSPDNSDTTNRPMEPVEVLGSQAADYLWLDELDLADMQQRRHYETFQHLERRRSKSSKKRKSKANKKLHDHDSQCSLI